MHTKIKSRLSIKSGILALAIVFVLAGAAYAALQKSAILKGNAIQTASANLQLSSDNSNFGDSMPGYAFTNMIPGGQAVPQNGYPIYIKNAGTTSLSLKLALAKPVINPDNIDLSKVRLIITPMNGGASQAISLADMTADQSLGGTALNVVGRMIPGQNTGYTIKAQMDADAVSGSSASLNDIDLSFNATAVN